ncbi:MAG: hypothetical protein U1E05_19425 [Patescibacteria group bacterium]|nr:hypothetical protein [Patescibacteria group bacterium]
MNTEFLHSSIAVDPYLGDLVNPCIAEMPNRNPIYHLPALSNTLTASVDSEHYEAFVFTTAVD